MRNELNKVFCFGAFDGIHEGHIQMLTEAKSLGNYLIVALTQDAVLEKLKQHKPRSHLAERIQAVIDLQLANEVIPGDPDIEQWQVLQQCQPNIIALGYDQMRLQQALTNAIQTFSFSPQIVILKPYKPETMHSSLLFGDKKAY